MQSPMDRRLAYTAPLLIAVTNGWLACVVALCEAGCAKKLPSEAEFAAILIHGNGATRQSQGGSEKVSCTDGPRSWPP